MKAPELVWILQRNVSKPATLQSVVLSSYWLRYPSSCTKTTIYFYSHLSLLHKVSRRSLSSSSPSRNNFSASLLASSSLPLFPSGLWFMDRHEWRRDLRGHRRLMGEPTNSPWPPWLVRPNRFSVDLLAKIWRTSTGLRIRGELQGEH